MPELTGTAGTSVNGPEGLPSFDGDAWERVDWRFHEEQVRRLRGRIFKAVQAGDWPLARNLQKLALRSWSNTLVSVRQVTQRNTGRRTAGIDGQVALTSQVAARYGAHAGGTWQAGGTAWRAVAGHTPDACRPCDWGGGNPSRVNVGPRRAGATRRSD